MSLFADLNFLYHKENFLILTEIPALSNCDPINGALFVAYFGTFNFVASFISHLDPG